MPTSLPLGQSVEYPESYTPSVLCAVPRSLGREALSLPTILPFQGTDLWTAYELSWLNSKGKPEIGILELSVPCNSANIIESKSLKLYLGSFNQTSFVSKDEVLRSIQRDLASVLGSELTIKLSSLPAFTKKPLVELAGDCIDDLDVTIDRYQPDVSSLVTSSNITEETLHSHLLKTNCRITAQPDWASVLIRYRGKQIDKKGLLKYIISFRLFNEFHESCVEKIFCDILNYCQPSALTVYARYTRRGGIDINPFRSNFESPPDNDRLARQ